MRLKGTPQDGLELSRLLTPKRLANSGVKVAANQLKSDPDLRAIWEGVDTAKSVTATKRKAKAANAKGLGVSNAVLRKLVTKA